MSDQAFYDRLKQAFDYFDKDKSGSIDRNEFLSLLEWAKLVDHPSQNEIDQAFTKVFYFF